MNGQMGNGQVIKQIMSIYSGFPTRKDETNYNQLLARIIQLLQAHLLEVLPPQKLSNSKIFAYSRVITKMQQYEQHKYLPPKFSHLLQPLSNLIGLPTKVQDDEVNQSSSAFASPKQKIKSFHSNSQYNGYSEIKEQSLSTYRHNQERDAFAQTKIRTRKSSKGSQHLSKKKEHKFHGSFYDIQQRKIRIMHERYNSRVQEVNQRIGGAQHDDKNYRSQTQSPADIYKQLKASKYDPADKYGIIHMKALKQAQEQLKPLKSSTPKQTRVRTQFM